MTITIEAIEKRIADLERGRAELVAQAHAHTGAIQDCEFWREQLMAGERVQFPPPDPNNDEN